LWPENVPAPDLPNECDVVAWEANPAFLCIWARTFTVDIANSPNPTTRMTNFFEFIWGIVEGSNKYNPTAPERRDLFQTGIA
jgi:hypothetical protein